VDLKQNFAETKIKECRKETEPEEGRIFEKL